MYLPKRLCERPPECGRPGPNCGRAPPRGALERGLELNDRRGALSPGVEVALYVRRGPPVGRPELRLKPPLLEPELF